MSGYLSILSHELNCLREGEKGKEREKGGKEREKGRIRFHCSQEGQKKKYI